MAAPYRACVRSRSRSPGAFETVEQTPIGEHLQSFHCNRRPCTKSRQAFQSSTISGGNRDICVQAKSIHGGATRTGKSLHAFRIDLISSMSHTFSGIGARGTSATHRGGVDTCQPGLIARARIRLFRIALGTETTLL